MPASMATGERRKLLRRGIATGWRIAAPHATAPGAWRMALVRTSPLFVALALMALALGPLRPEVLAVGQRRLFAGAVGVNLVARRETDLQFDDFIPLRIGPLPFRNRKQFAQALTQLVFWCIHHGPLGLCPCFVPAAIIGPRGSAFPGADGPRFPYNAAYNQRKNHLIRFAALGSGSRGNAMAVQSARTTLLIDCGFGPRELTRRLGRLDLAPDDIDAILITHEHSDHIGGAAACARRFGIPLYMTHGTRAAGLRDDGDLDVRIIDSHQAFTIDAFEVQPFPVPHDAREPAQFTVSDGQWRFGMLTDIGMSTPHVIEVLSLCDALVLECNHDAAMLAGGSYPHALKQRIAGRFGHLENNAAARLLAQLDIGRLQHVVAAHLSEQNNTVELATAALAAAVGCEPSRIGVAHQDAGSDWRAIN